MSFVRGPNPIWFYANLVGQPVDDTYYAFFLTNTLPYLPQNVYMDPNGTIPWSNPIEFQPSSGLPNNLYFDPSFVYRIEIRQGNTQADPLIYLIENYSLEGESATVDIDPLVTAENMITNPQFADISFVSPLTITTAGTHEIAPGWFLVTQGAGSTTLTQISRQGSTNVFGQPPYSLSIQNSGWSSVKLVQRFDNNGAIYDGPASPAPQDGAIAVAFTALASSPPLDFTVNYAPSNVTPIPIFDSQIISSALTEYKNAISIPASTNTDTPPAAYVDIEFVLRLGNMEITNIQITGQSTPLSPGFIGPTQSPHFQQTTYERVVDHEFHLYRDATVRQPKDNILVGWTFAQNPWQFRTTALTNVSNVPTAQYYTADQTIIIQQNAVNTGTFSNVAVGRGTAAQNYAFVVSGVTATNKFAMIQYIDPATIRSYWGDVLSLMVNAKLSANNVAGAVKFKVRLLSATILPPTITNSEPISGWLPAANPTFSGTWTEIIPLNDPEYTLTTDAVDFSFDKFQLPASTSDNMTLAVAIYITSPLDIGNQILFNRVSLVNNDFAIEANPETADETLRKCQYYYETSYVAGADIGTVTNIGMKYFVNPLNQNGAGSGVFLNPNVFEVAYRIIKRDTPTLYFYSPNNGTLGQVFAFVANSAGAGGYTASGNFTVSSFWNPIMTSNRNSIYFPNTITQLLGSFTGLQQNQGGVYYHYVADSRLGR